jgi:CDP-4-dehydro-6-deoxyglucose reductase, E1
MPFDAATRRLGRARDEIRSDIMRLVEEYCDAAHGPQPFVAGNSNVPVSGRVYDSSDVKSLIDASLDFWLTTGRFNEQFEKDLSARVRARYSLTVNSGSSANLVAFSALTSPLLGERRLLPGSEVITAATGFPTTVNPSMLWGMVPVFLDVDIPTYNLLPEAVEAAITSKTRAIMVAHTLGNPFDAERIAAIARKHGLFLIEDCCDALGATINGRHVGTFGDIGTLSFYPAHQITMGEGGAVFTSHPVLRRAMETFRDWGRDCYCEPGKDNTCKRRFDWQLGELPHGYDHKYIYSHMGFNLKITDMQAAVGVAQLGHLDDFVQARRRNFDMLKEGLRDLEEYFVLPEATPNSQPSWFGFVITLRDNAPLRRDDIVRHLNDRKIGTRLLFGGNLIRQPYMKGRNYRVHGELANSDRIVNQTFWIGVYPGLGAEHIGYVLETIHEFCKSPAFS